MRTCFFLFLLLLAPAAAAQAPPDTALTAGEVVRRVLHTYPTVEAARAGVEAAAARVGQARSAYLPNVSGVGQYRRQDPVPQFALPGGGEPVSIQPNNNYNAHLELQQTIYDFGRTASRIDVAEAGRRVAETRIGQVQNGLAFRALQHFYRVLLLNERLRVQNQRIDQLQQALQVTRRRREAGTATNFEVLQIQTRISSAKSQRLDVQRQRSNQKTALRQLLDVDSAEPLALSGDFQPAPVQLDTARLVATALRERPEVRVARAQAEQAGASIDAARASDNPRFGLNAQGGYKNGYPGNLDEMRANEVIGLSLRVPIFDGLRTHHQIEEAQANAHAARARLADTRRMVTTDARQAAHDVEAARARLQATDQQVQQARQALQLARRRYRAGTITNLDLLDAVTRLAQARLSNARALYNVLIAQYGLQRAAGTLTDRFRR